MANCAWPCASSSDPRSASTADPASLAEAIGRGSDRPAASPMRRGCSPPDRSMPCRDRGEPALGSGSRHAFSSAARHRRHSPDPARTRYARNTVIGYGGMGHVGRPKPRHMTAHAFIGRLMTFCGEEIAMAGEAHPLDGLHLFSGLACGLWHVPHHKRPPLCRAHWLRASNSLWLTARSVPARSPQIGYKDALGRIARLEVPPIAAGIQYPDFPLQVALLAYAVARPAPTWLDSRWNPARGS